MIAFKCDTDLLAIHLRNRGFVCELMRHNALDSIYCTNAPLNLIKTKAVALNIGYVVTRE